MGRVDQFEQRDRNAAETILQTMTADLKTLQEELVNDLSQDVRRLQAEKSRLLNEIEKLQNQHQILQSQQEVLLSRQQMAQQQAWAKQLAIVLANHLHTALTERLTQSIDTYLTQGTADNPSTPPRSLGQAEAQDAYRLLSSLDDTVDRAFTSLRHDLNSYQSSLSQQIDRMHDLGQQGEAILKVLVGRISQYLQIEAAKNQSTQLTATYTTEIRELPNQPAAAPLPSAPPQPAIAPAPAPVRRSSRRPKPQHGVSNFHLGIILVLLSTLALSIHNVVVGIVGTPSNLFGIMPIGGFIQPNFASSLLILWMRMLVVMLLMPFLASWLHPATWKEIKNFALSNDSRLLGSVIGSGFFLFLSQVLIYLAIPQIGPGVAITILFMYPLITVPLAWLLFGDRPTRLRILVMILIFSGILLTTRYAATANLSVMGVTTALGSGICFALYLVTMQLSFRKLHPIPVSLVQFATIFVLSSISLMVHAIDAPPQDPSGFFTSCLLLGGLTLMGYLLNNIGVRFLGAAQASIIAASGPALTALLAVWMIPGDRTFLSFAQVVGILVVCLGVVMLSYERMLLQNKTAARRATKPSASPSGGS
jgi:drug/metabolite transporter (DMT)-like permease/cell division septum initiation protein DivIVA